MRLQKDSEIVVTDNGRQYHATLLRYLDENADHHELIECRFLDGSIFYYLPSEVRPFCVCPICGARGALVSSLVGMICPECAALPRK